MASTLTDNVKLASGYNEVGDLLALHELAPPMFSDYKPKGGVLSDWHDAEAYQVDGLGLQVPIGLPYVEWSLFNLLPEEYAYLKQFIGPVTAWIYNKGTAAYGAYNGILDLKDESSREWGEDDWAKVTVLIRYLVAI